MKSLWLAVILGWMVSTVAWAQSDSTYYAGAQPDLPGMLLVDFGFNFLQDAPDTMDLRTWGSRGFGIQYLYPIPIGDSKFSLHTGLGLGFENFSFKNPITLTDTKDSTQVTTVTIVDSLTTTWKKSQLSTHYIDLPLELRYFAKENYRGFTFAVGGKVGRLMNSFTKIKYEDDGVNEEDKLKRRYNLNPWRYGVHARVGFRGITLTGQYMFSKLFSSGEGPPTNNFKVGLTIGLF